MPAEEREKKEYASPHVLALSSAKSLGAFKLKKKKEYMKIRLNNNGLERARSSYVFLLRWKNIRKKE